jgi:hypothetical protein
VEAPRAGAAPRSDPSTRPAYTDDAIYSDLAVPAGVRGHDEILAYFRQPHVPLVVGRLLVRYPDWVWANTRVQPLSAGFLNYWHATIPDGDRVVECDGVCTVIVENGRICRNGVFLDRSDLLHQGGAAEASPHPGGVNGT